MTIEQTEAIPARDTVQAVIADPHIGSNYSIFHGKTWRGKNEKTHNASSSQIKTTEWFYEYARRLSEFRKGRRLTLILAGDLIEGLGFGTSEIWAGGTEEMAHMAQDILFDFKQRVNWDRGDKLHVVKGTLVHVGDQEEGIAQALDAEQGADGYYSHNQIDIITNGITTTCVHHGPGAGTGANEASPEYNWLKTNYFNSMRDEKTPKDIYYSAHVHKPAYATYSWRRGWDTVKTMHGVIAPSWKRKDRFAAKVSKCEYNYVGGFYQLITADGVIDTPKFCIMPDAV
jgi:hypothetical protein